MAATERHSGPDDTAPRAVAAGGADAAAPAPAVPAPAAPAAAVPGQAGPRPAGRQRQLRRGLALAAVLLVAALALFAVYLRLAWTVPVNSDAAGNLLQAWDMLHGNPLLRGWELSDTSFYTTELPQYALIAVVLGRTAAVVHVASAMTYTLALLLAALLARGRTAGWAGAARMAVAAGIMLAPQPGLGVFILLSSPGHIGTAVPLLLIWLILDRAGRRWWAPPLAGVLLAWAMIGDSLVLIAGIAPIALVCAVQAYRRIVMARERLRPAWYELALAAAAVAAVAVAAAVTRLLSDAHGYSTQGVPKALITGAQLPQHAAATFESILLVFGADFLGLSRGTPAALVAVHLAGVLLAALGTAAAVRAFFRTARPDLVAAMIAASVLILLIAYLFSALSTNAFSAREIAAVLPFGAALAGRMLTGRLIRARLAPVLALVLAGYAAALVTAVSLPRVPAENQQAAQFLVAHHLTYGLGGYWQAASITIGSGGHAVVRQIQVVGGSPRATQREAKASWFSPQRHQATFIVLGPGKPGTPPLGSVSALRAMFGPPQHVYRLGPDTVLTYRKNLLADLHPPG